jgi:hypothetical protein
MLPKGLIKYPFTTPAQNLYIRAHPVVFWLCVGLAVVGFVGAFLPFLLVASAVSQVLPEWLQRLFYGIYMLGAVFAVIAQLRAIPKLEAAGMSLLATGFLVQFLSVLYLLHAYFWQGLFLLTLAIGTEQRSIFLSQYGYPMRKLDGGD